ncbi:transporter substrate-binding domain-containing protein [Spirulina subsalsa]|uniref:transporter substrate-binding domain-containing protein n=1 Tax=Spirulina subsalsa TaxID=54311 RepID=UPI0002F42F48|nr:transporter substrate-binding domain-containing protein [Spirulina subsalsa]
MKSFKTFLSLVIITFLSCLLFAACSPKTLVMGTSADYPPYEFKEQSGEIVGFDVDIARRLAAKLKFNLEIEDMNFDNLIPALTEGEVDFVMAGMSPTEERKQQVNFTEIYYKGSSILLTRRGSNFTLGDNAPGAKIGAQKGSTQASAVGKLDGVELVEMDRIGNLIQGVKENQLQGAVIEATVAETYAASNPDLDFSVPFDTGSQGSAIAFPKDSPHLESFNKALREMEENGEITELIRKWFG